MLSNSSGQLVQKYFTVGFRWRLGEHASEASSSWPEHVEDLRFGELVAALDVTAQDVSSSNP